MGDSRGHEVNGVSGFFIAFSWIFVLLRSYCRIFLVKSFGLDDALCLAAQVLFTVYCAFASAAVASGLGSHITDVPRENIPFALKWLWISDPFYVFCNMLLKFSIGAFLLRICVSNIQRAIIWVVIVVSGIVCIFFSCIALFQCWPVTYFWEQGTGQEGKCLGQEVIVVATYAYSAMSCWSDWTYCIVPAFMIWNLQMSRQTKICVCLILGVSSIASLITIIRIPSIAELNQSDDFLYASTYVTLWSICETGLALAACAAATLRPLIRVFSSTSTSQYPNGSAVHQSAHHDTWPARSGYARNGSRTDKYDIGVETNIRTNNVSGDGDAIYLSRWPEDDRSSNAEGERVSNSSQTKLKTDLETGLTVDKFATGIKKTVVVSSHSVRV